MEIHIINAYIPLIDEEKLVSLSATKGKWTSIQVQENDIEDASYIRLDDLFASNHVITSNVTSRWDANGKIMLPGLIDAHVHLDKAFTIDKIGNNSGTLLEAIHNFREAAPAFSKKTIKERMKKTVMHAVAYGTTALRSHLDFNMSGGGEVAQRTIEAALEVKDELKDLVNLQFFPMCDFTRLSSQGVEILEDGLKQGLDGIGGAPHLSDNPQQNIGEMFRIAEKHAKPIDLHSDESDDPAMETVNEIAKQTIRYGFQGKVNVGHLCSLSAMNQKKADETIENITKAKLNVISLPGANMYLQGREDRGLIRRGVTRVKELTEAGVKTAVASDNIQDPFHPFGKGDLIQIGLLATYAAHMNSEPDKLTTLKMITEIPAELIGLDDYQIAVGNPVSFTVIDATSVNDLFAWVPVNRWVYKNNDWVCITRQMQSWNEVGAGVASDQNAFPVFHKR